MENKKEHKKKPTPLEDAKKENKELLDQLQRLQAEFENYKKRTDKNNSRLLEYAKISLIKDLLPVLDSFELSLAHTENTNEFVKGIKMVHEQFLKLLKKEGLTLIDCVGKRFDPFKHEVMLTQNKDCKEDTILQELQKGYMLKDEVIRHSKVCISKKKEDKKNEN